MDEPVRDVSVPVREREELLDPLELELLLLDVPLFDVPLFDVP